MTDILIYFLASIGALFILLAAIGFVRMPDLYMRISVTTKAATLGIGLLLACAAIHFGELAITSRVLAIILFMLLTAPVGAHLIGRVSYLIGDDNKLWHKSVMDELANKYDKKTHSLKGGDSEEKPGDDEKTNGANS